MGIPGETQAVSGVRDRLDRWLDGHAVEAAAIAYTANRKRDWDGFSPSQRSRAIRAMFVAVRAYLDAEAARLADTSERQPQIPGGNQDHD